MPCPCRPVPALLAGLVLLTLSLLSPAARAQDNVLVVIADDLGVEMVQAYGEGPFAPPTPNIDRLAEEGVLFRNAWANPSCSPTRAHIQTGRYGFRTGLGMVINNTGWSLQPNEVTAVEMIGFDPGSPYTTGFIGKWHLSNANTGLIDGALLQGFDHFTGIRGNIQVPQTFHNWFRIEGGVEALCTTYATTQQVDDALAFIDAQTGPWVCYLAFNAPHEPFHDPPHALYTVDVPPVDPRFAPHEYYRAAVEAMDTELGRLFAGLGPRLNETNIVFIADNGTPQDASKAPFVPEHAKLTPYEGGLNVPLLVRGPAVVEPGREVTALVNAVDLFRTVIDLTGTSVLQPVPMSYVQDSVSLVPYLEDPHQDPIRPYVYADHFAPNSSTGFGMDFTQRAIRDERYKLIEFFGPNGLRFEFYDLQNDPFETFDLDAYGLYTLEASDRRRWLLRRLNQLTQ